MGRRLGGSLAVLYNPCSDGLISRVALFRMGCFLVRFWGVKPLNLLQKKMEKLEAIKETWRMSPFPGFPPAIPDRVPFRRMWQMVCRHFHFLILIHSITNACARFVIKKIQDGGRRRPGDGARKLSGKSTIFVYSLPFPLQTSSSINSYSEYNGDREPR